MLDRIDESRMATSIDPEGNQESVEAGPGGREQVPGLVAQGFGQHRVVQFGAHGQDFDQLACVAGEGDVEPEHHPRPETQNS